ncbi:hypothetical protein [Henriciella marina]|uniref:hypothetical protein n=1 Tax=Henriciella marina TaxID=453851 RepID=UPI0003692604|nr:hypothetical protein [Henriciella marina]
MSRVFVIIFLAFLLAPTISGFFGIQPKSIENRDLEKPPAPSVHSIMNAEYFLEAGAYLKDNLPLRIEAVRLHNWLLLHSSAGSVSPRVYQGRGGELFLDIEIKSPCSRPVFPADLIEMVEKFQTRAERNHQTFYFVFMPNKAFSYPERMTSALAGMEACAASRRAELRAAMRESPARFVDLWTPTEQHVQDEGERLFPKLGRHSTTFAGVFFARELLNEIAPGKWDPDALQAVAEHTVSSELPLRFMGLNLPETRTIYHVDRGPALTTRYEEIKLTPESTRNSFRFTTTGADDHLVTGRTMVFHDSFMDAPRDILAPYFEEIYFIHWGEFMAQPEKVREILFPADRVIFAYVEDLKEEAVPNTIGSTLRLDAYSR